MPPTLVLTGDGSHSLRNEALGVSYHSKHGAIQESRHIFIEAGLQAVLDGDRPCAILEMGFGTGLNALLVRQFAQAHPQTEWSYTTYERYPIPETQAAQLNYPQQLAVPADWLQQLHACPWGQTQQLNANFTFTKYRDDFAAPETSVAVSTYDVIFFDAFAPEDQPELWSVSVLRRCYRALRPGGCLVTYCAQGQFRRDLRAAGFRTEKLPGPVGKREITRAWRDVA